MAVIRNNFEQYYPGNAPGGFGGNVSQPFLVSDANPMHGNRHVRMATPGTATPGARRTFTASPAIEFITYLYLDSLNLPASSNYDCVWLRAAGDAAAAVRIRILTSGLVRLVGTGGAVLWTSTQPFPIGSYVRIGLYVEAGTSPTTGAARLAFYAGDGTTPIEDSGLVSGVNVASSYGAFDNAAIGKQNTANLNSTGDFDDFVIRTDINATQNFLPIIPSTFLRVSGSWKSAEAHVRVSGSWRQSEIVHE